MERPSLKPVAFLVVVLLLRAAAMGFPSLVVESPDAPAPSKVTAATYFYEKDDSSIPPAVQSGLNRLNRERGIVATAEDDDVKDGDGEVPDQYRISLPKAKEIGVPCLVVMAGEQVVNTVKAPTTEGQVLEAVP